MLLIFYNLLSTVWVFLLFLVIIGEQNSEGNTEHKVRERKSSSISDREPTMSSSKTNSLDTRSSKASKVSPNPGCISFSFLLFLLFPSRLLSYVYIFWTCDLINKVPLVKEQIFSVIYLVPFVNVMISTIFLAVKLVTPPLLSPSPAPTPQQIEKDASRGKNKFFLARWFGFGSGSKWIDILHVYHWQLAT